MTADWSLPILMLIWVRSFIETDSFENNVGLLFDSTAPIYLINMLWKLGLGLWLDSDRVRPIPVSGIGQYSPLSMGISIG